MRARTTIACLACALLLPFAAATAHAERVLESKKLLLEEGLPQTPPSEGEIEGACGLAVSPGGSTPSKGGFAAPSRRSPTRR
jgi:hypothetical protein